MINMMKKSNFKNILTQILFNNKKINPSKIVIIITSHKNFTKHPIIVILNLINKKEDLNKKLRKMQ